MTVRRVDWSRILSRARVPFITSGANVKRGEFNIRCPLCGSADPSYHMGLNPDNGYWACWRNVSHRGKNPIRLVMILLNVPYREAAEIAGLELSGESPVSLEGFGSKIRSFLGGKKSADEVAKQLAFPDDFRPLASSGLAGRRFRAYLADVRGFLPDDVEQMSKQYDLQFAISGRQMNRIVFPFYRHGALMSWTGRAIGKSTVRYLDVELAAAVLPPKRMLYNYDQCSEGGDSLVLVEGPMDAIKLDFYGQRYGVRAVAMSTASLSEEQVWDLSELSSRFNEIWVMVDSGGFQMSTSIRIANQISFIRKDLKIKAVPFGRKDAAELSASQIGMFAQGFV